MFFSSFLYFLIFSSFCFGKTKPDLNQNLNFSFGINFNKEPSTPAENSFDNQSLVLNQTRSIFKLQWTLSFFPNISHSSKKETTLGTDDPFGGTRSNEILTSSKTPLKHRISTNVKPNSNKTPSFFTPKFIQDKNKTPSSSGPIFLQEKNKTPSSSGPIFLQDKNKTASSLGPKFLQDKNKTPSSSGPIFLQDKNKTPSSSGPIFLQDKNKTPSSLGPKFLQDKNKTPSSSGPIFLQDKNKTPSSSGPIFLQDKNKTPSSSIPKFMQDRNKTPSFLTPKFSLDKNKTPSSLGPIFLQDKNKSPSFLTPKFSHDKNKTPSSLGPIFLQDKNKTPSFLTPKFSLDKNKTPSSLGPIFLQDKNKTPSFFTPKFSLDKNKTPSSLGPKFLLNRSKRDPYQVTSSVLNNTDRPERLDSNSKISKRNTTKTRRKPSHPTRHLLQETPLTKVNLSSSLCVVSLVSKEGVITNRGYPYAYDDAEHCQWVVRSPHRPHIKVTFEDLDLEFEKDILEISFTVDDEYYSRRYTGNKMPPATVWDTDQITIDFKTDISGHGRGFYIYFEETNEVPSFPIAGSPQCSELHLSKTGSLMTPGYPHKHYSNNELCSWVIAAPANSVIKLEIMEFHTEIYDQLTIGLGLDARKNASSNLIRLFGSVDTPQETIIPANALWLRFNSDETITAKGFHINYLIIERHICKTKKDFTAAEGVLYSEDYPQEYPINSECRWTIHGEKGSRVLLKFLHFHLQEGHDFLLVGEGPDVFVGNFTQFTGQIEKVRNLTMKTNTVWLHFTSDHVRGDRFYSGFKIAYSIEKDQTKPQTTLENTILPQNWSTEVEGLSISVTDTSTWSIPTNIQLMSTIHANNKTEVEENLEFLLESLAKDFVQFCRREGLDDCLLRNEDIHLLSVVKDKSARNKFSVHFELHYGGNQITPEVSEDLKKFFNASEIQLPSSRFTNEETLASSSSSSSSDGFYPESSVLPSWLIAVIASIILLVIVFFAMLFYSLTKAKNAHSNNGSCHITSSGLSNTLEVNNGEDENKIISYGETREMHHHQQQQLQQQEQLKTISSKETKLHEVGNGVTVLSILPPTIETDIDIMTTCEMVRNHELLIPVIKPIDVQCPVESSGLSTDEVSTDL